MLHECASYRGRDIQKNRKSIDIENKPNLTLSEKYEYWTVGITNDWERRKKEHEYDNKNVTHWRSWPADTEEIARMVENHFLKYGVKGGGGGSTNPTHVYIF